MLKGPKQTSQPTAAKVRIEPEAEYDGYLIEVSEKLEQGTTRAQLIDYLVHAAVISMNSPVGAQRKATALADALLRDEPE
jgi:hypothetical protein